MMEYLLQIKHIAQSKCVAKMAQKYNAVWCKLVVQHKKLELCGTKE